MYLKFNLYMFTHILISDNKKLVMRFPFHARFLEKKKMFYYKSSQITYGAHYIIFLIYTDMSIAFVQPNHTF
jgi:hypothetical protein